MNENLYFNVEGLIDRQIGMESLDIDRAKEEAKMAKIENHVYC